MYTIQPFTTTSIRLTTKQNVINQQNIFTYVKSTNNKIYFLRFSIWMFLLSSQDNKCFQKLEVTLHDKNRYSTNLTLVLQKERNGDCTIPMFHICQNNTIYNVVWIPMLSETIAQYQSITVNRQHDLLCFTSSIDLFSLHENLLDFSSSDPTNNHRIWRPNCGFSQILSVLRGEAARPRTILSTFKSLSGLSQLLGIIQFSWTFFMFAQNNPGESWTLVQCVLVRRITSLAIFKLNLVARLRLLNCFTSMDWWLVEVGGWNGDVRAGLKA